MYSADDLKRIESIHKKLSSIFTIIERHGSITKALEDEVEGQAPILEHFDSLDIKGIVSVRNFIAHDYDGVNLSIVEESLREGIPQILNICGKLLGSGI